MKEVVARIKRGKKKFEILVDGVKAWEWKEGKVEDIRDVLIVEEIFRDAKSGDLPSTEELKSAFGTTDVLKIAEIILRDGEVPMPTEYRKKLIEQKRRQIMNYIAENAIDPRTGYPIPPQRIENAMEKARIHIDLHVPIEKQAEEIIKKIVTILPIKFEKKKIEVIVPPKYSGKLYGYLSKFKKVKENWLGDGSYYCVIEVPAGKYTEIISEISSRTKGEAKMRVM